MRIELKIMVWAAAFLCVLGSNGLVLGNDGAAIPCTHGPYNAPVPWPCGPLTKTLVVQMDEEITLIRDLEHCDAIAAWMRGQWLTYARATTSAVFMATAKCFPPEADDE